MTIPSNAYAVAYRISLHDHTGVDPVDIAIETTYPFSSSAGINPSPVVVAEDAAADAAMRAWKASVEASFPNASNVSAVREYLVRQEGGPWPS